MMVTLDEKAISEVVDAVKNILDKLKANNIDEYSITIEADDTHMISIRCDGIHTYSSYISTMR